MNQRKIPYLLIRGGSSKGVYFKMDDLPKDEQARDSLILAAMEGVGLGDIRQIDGLGGADPLTSKVALIRKSKNEKADLDYLFLQVMLGEGRLTTAQGCGNILAGVLHFAIETDMVEATDPTTTKTVQMLNGDGYCEITLLTPNKELQVSGSAIIDGVLGKASPIICNYLETAGSNCGTLFPTGNLIDVVDGIEVTCVDNGLPVVNLRASDFGISGYETKEELDNNTTLKAYLEAIRLQIGHKMKLGDVAHTTVPKMCLLSPAMNGGLVNTRSFIPKVCHVAIGVMAAFSTAVCAVLPGTVADGMITPVTDLSQLSLEHPSGELTVSLELTGIGVHTKVIKSGAIRTARIISKGEVYIPSLL